MKRRATSFVGVEARLPSGSFHGRDGKVPDVDRAVESAGCQGAAVGCEGQGVNSAVLEAFRADRARGMSQNVTKPCRSAAASVEPSGLDGQRDDGPFGARAAIRSPVRSSNPRVEPRGSLGRPAPEGGRRARSTACRTFEPRLGIDNRSRPFATSQTRTVRSPDEETMVVPSCENASAATKSACPSSAPRLQAVRASQSVIRPSCWPTARIDTIRSECQAGCGDGRFHASHQDHATCGPRCRAGPRAHSDCRLPERGCRS